MATVSSSPLWLIIFEGSVFEFRSQNQLEMQWIPIRLVRSVWKLFIKFKIRVFPFKVWRHS